MKHIWGMVAVGALVSMAAPAIADVKAGVDAWQQGDYAKAIGEWRPLAQSGDPDAQFNMGQAYKLGRGVQPDLPAAMDWYRKAASQGHLRAEDNLGLLMFQQGDRAGAMPYLQRAATRGEPRAQYIVATALFNGDLVGKDWVRAYALMTRASSSGLAQATTSLEQMDKYVPEDQRKQGLALAASMQTPDRSGTALASASPAAPRPAPPSSVRTTELPASTIAPNAAAPVVATPAKLHAAPNPYRQSPRLRSLSPRPNRHLLPCPLPQHQADGASNWARLAKESRARGLWSQLTGKVSGLSAYQPYLVKVGAVTRLQAGPVSSSDDANKLCSRIKATGADCIPKKM